MLWVLIDDVDDGPKPDRPEFRESINAAIWPWGRKVINVMTTEQAAEVSAGILSKCRGDKPADADLDASRAALDESDERIPYGRVRRELGLE